MLYAETLADMTPDELLTEYDWVARDKPVSQHEANQREWKQDRIHAALVARGIAWT